MLYRPGLLGRMPCAGDWYMPSAPPTLNFDFSSGSLPSGWSFTRASTATDSTYLDAPSQKTYNTFASNAPVITQWGTLVEPSATNYFLNSDSPVTQSITCAINEVVVVWMVGAGSVNCTAGTGAFNNLGSVGAGSWRTVTCTSGGTLTLTPSGGPWRVQAEKYLPASQSRAAGPTSYIPTGGSPITRAEVRLSQNFFGGQLNRLNGTYWIEVFRPTACNGERLMVAGTGSYSSDSESDQLITFLGFGATTFRSFSPASTQAGSINASPGSGNPVYQSIERFAATYDTQHMALCANYGPVVSTTITQRPSTLLAITLGGGGTGGVGGNHIPMCGYIRGFRYWPTTMSDQELHECTGPGYYGGKPVLDLDVTTSAGLAQINTSRTTNAWYVNSSGVITVAFANVPRIEYDPTTLQLKGLLIEEQRINFYLGAGDFNTAYWSKVNCTATTAATAPDGGSTARGIICNSGVGGYCSQTMPVTAGTTYTQSIFYKAGTVSQAIILMNNSGWADGVIRSATFDFSGAGSVVSVAGGGAVAGIQQYPNGWYRCWMTATPDISTTIGTQVARSTVNGDGTSIQFYAWGTQFEASSYMTSYINTTTATVTRAADIFTMPVGPWFNPNAGSMLAEFIDRTWNVLGAGRNGGLLFFDPNVGNSQNAIYLISYTNNYNMSQLNGAVRASAANSAAFQAFSNFITLGSICKFSAAWDTLQLVGYANGQYSQTVSLVGPLPTGMSRLTIGLGYSGVANLNGYLRRIRYWDYKLTPDAQQAQTQ